MLQGGPEPMSIHEHEAKSILLKRKYIDSWFVARYGLNIYRGCAHNCSYCDGRAEGYYVEGDFGRDVTAKINAPIMLDRALDPARKRKPLRRGFIMLGGGVGDSYQPAEQLHTLTRACLEVIERHRDPVHILTKSTLVERDLDLLTRINGGQRAVLSMSFSTVDDGIARVFEPGCSRPSHRLATLRLAKQQGLTTGMYLMPVIPGVSDKAEAIDAAVVAAQDAQCDFVVFGGMTLKPGRQRDHHLKVIEEYDPTLIPKYQMVYGNDRWGSASPPYYQAIQSRFIAAVRKHRMARWMPPRVFADVIDQDDVVVVILEQLHSLLRAQGKPSPYRTAARTLAALGRPISELRNRLHTLNGISGAVAATVVEILDTGSCALYESTLYD
jgi:DNA repair photolyase